MRILLSALVLLMGCEAITNPLSVPPDGVTFGPPPIYQTWWRETEACSGITADFHRVRWFTAPLVTVNGTRVAAYTNWKHHAISMDAKLAFVADTGYVPAIMSIRHEMLHDLIQQSGHPTEFFVVKCGEVVLH